jgi:hypothetical protein
MIFSPHIVVGAVIGAKTHNLGLIIILGLASHFILDRIPHWEYDISKNMDDFRTGRKIKGLSGLFLKIFLDAFIGLLIVLIPVIQRNLLDLKFLMFIFLGILFSVLPDILWGLSGFIKNKFFDTCAKIHSAFHFQKQKEGKITFLGLFTQIVVIIFALLGFFV